MMTQAPTDRGNFDVLGAVAAEMVNDRQYGQVQSAMDDLRAAERKGTALPVRGNCSRGLPRSLPVAFR